ncbi:hypothetical protein J1605_018729 [Eschrichtius robustus]|uniref:Uncharacterized protein n=1 Tax=Eschrichtius robustus TaxID=9764 RepID=A0AB34HUX0_ESCRO|nr:hypothetical protein J1605_018729 [Eschrichtius robustus]
MGGTASCRGRERCELHYPESTAPRVSGTGPMKTRAEALPSGGRRLGGPSGVDRRRHFVNSDLVTGGEVEDAGPARDQGTRKLLRPLL